MQIEELADDPNLLRSQDENVVCVCVCGGGGEDASPG
jgi:hypothetical protein